MLKLISTKILSYLSLGLSSLLVIGTPISQAQAGTLVLSGTGTNPNSGGTTNALAAQVTFDDSLISQGQLKIRLENIGPGSSVPSDILTAIFWDMTNSNSLSLTSATAQTIIPNAATSPINIQDVNGTAPDGIEWGFSSNSNGLGGNTTPDVIQQYGLGTAGFGVQPGFGLSGGQQFNYGIVSTPFDSPNTQLTSTGNTFVVGAADFVLSGLSTNFNLNSISNVRFQYGTALSEPSFGSTPTSTANPTSVPEPGATVALGLLALGGVKLLKKKSSIQDVAA